MNDETTTIVVISKQMDGCKIFIQIMSWVGILQWQWTSQRYVGVILLLFLIKHLYLIGGMVQWGSIDQTL